MKQIKKWHKSNRDLQKFIKTKNSNLIAKGNKSNILNSESEIPNYKKKIKSSSNIYMKYKKKEKINITKTSNKKKSWSWIQFDEKANHLNKDQKPDITKKRTSKISKNQNKTSSSFNSKNTFNIFEKFDTHFEKNILSKNNTEDTLNNSSSQVFLKTEEEDQDLKFSPKLTKFIMNLHSSRKFIQNNNSKKNNRKDHYHSPTSKKSDSNKSLGKIKSYIGSKLNTSTHSRSSNNSNKVAQMKNYCQLSPDLNSSFIKKNNSSNKQNHFIKSPIFYQNPESNISKKKSKKKLNSKSCSFSLNDLSGKADSIDSLKISKRTNENSNLSEFSYKSKTSTDIQSNKKPIGIHLRQESLKGNLDVIKETYIKVNKFNPKSKNKKNKIEIKINSDQDKNVQMNGNTYNVHYNNIYNGPPMPVNPMMNIQVPNAPSDMHMMNRPGHSNMPQVAHPHQHPHMTPHSHHQMHPLQFSQPHTLQQHHPNPLQHHQHPHMANVNQMPTTPHMPPNLRSFPAHPQMPQMNQMGYMNPYPYPNYQCRLVNISYFLDPHASMPMTQNNPISLISKPSPDEVILPNVYNGILKFFNPQKDYGFLIAESTKEEFFVHKQQLLQAGTNMSTINFYPRVKYQFQVASYIGKHGKAKKAVNLKILQ